MTIVLDHTIVPARDKEGSARFFAHIFGLEYEIVRNCVLLVRRLAWPTTPERRQPWVVADAFEDMRAPTLRERHAQVIVCNLCRLNARSDQHGIKGCSTLIAAC